MPNCSVTRPLVDPDPGAYTFAAWRCLIQMVNAFLQCIADNGGPVIELLSEASNTEAWKCQEMHDKLYQICPAIMGEAPNMWSRDWVQRVLSVLEHGSCVPLNAGAVDGEVIAAYTAPKGRQGYTLESIYDVIDRQAYRDKDYVEWHMASWMASVAGIDVASVAIPYSQSDDVTLWYSFTRNQMVPYSELLESDFFFTDAEYASRTVVNRYPVSVATEDEIIIAASPPTDEENPDFYDDYMAYLAADGHVSTYASTTTTQQVRSSYMQQYAFIPQPVSTAGLRIADTATYNIPATFIEDPAFASAPGEVKPLANIAKVLWALRQSHRRHLQAWRQLDPDPSLPINHPDQYHKSYCEVTGIAFGNTRAGTSLPPLILTLNISDEAEDWSNNITCILARQWNYQTQELRIDFAYPMQVPVASGATPSGPIPPLDRYSPQGLELNVTYPGGASASVPSCDEAWRF